MAKHGNKKADKDQGPKGPCTSCKAVTGPFKPVRYHNSNGKATMVQYCSKCFKWRITNI